jgi:tRNA dimethylallyltransferase
MDTQKPDIVVVCGPTGIGKTTAAIRLAEAFSGEIVGADSMQIYQLMEIGTAKPTPEEQARIPHHMIDIISPDAPFDAARYEKMAREIILDLYKLEKLPIVAGGTGFYIKALTQGLFGTAPNDPAIRERLRKEAADVGNDIIFQRLKDCDPATAQKLHPNDTYRILRALEVYEITGKPISSHQANHRFHDRPFRQLTIGLTMPREVLYERIDARVDAMLKEGLLDEVRKLLDKGYAPSLKSMQSIGYRHMVDFIQGHLSWEEAVRTMKRDTRRYAKRQMTWFKTDPDIHWVAPDRIEEMKQLVKTFLEKNKYETTIPKMHPAVPSGT